MALPGHGLSIPRRANNWSFGGAENDGLPGAGVGPDVDAGVHGVAVDRGQLLRGEVAVACRGQVLLELRDM
jgi:hypothetical protein